MFGFYNLKSIKTSSLAIHPLKIPICLCTRKKSDQVGKVWLLVINLLTLIRFKSTSHTRRKSCCPCINLLKYGGCRRSWSLWILWCCKPTWHVCWWSSYHMSWSFMSVNKWLRLLSPTDWYKESIQRSETRSDSWWNWPYTSGWMDDYIKYKLSFCT